MSNSWGKPKYRLSHLLVLVFFAALVTVIYQQQKQIAIMRRQLDHQSILVLGVQQHSVNEPSTLPTLAP